VEAYGCVDELNAALGFGRASAERQTVRDQLLAVQKDLVVLMGELATGSEDLERYAKDGFPLLTAAHTATIEQWIKDIESHNINFRGWATPGGTVHSAALDLARTVCRRAERRVCALHESQDLHNPEIIIYLNRLSDWLWLLARSVELDFGNPGPQTS
jgi:cob(I)alamin adenosyltransferase